VGAVVLGSDFKALGLIRSLGRRGIPSLVVDNLPRSGWFSRYVVGRVRWHGPMSEPAFLDVLLSLARDRGVEHWVLFPTQDEVLELVARNAARLSRCYRLVTPEWDRLRWAHDKRLLHRVAAEVGIAAPRTWYPSDEGDLERLAITLPAIVKPAFSLRLAYQVGRKALPARTAAELLLQYRRAATIIDPDELMVQETIPGDGRTQFSVAAFCREGRVVMGMTARRTRQFPRDYGLSSSFVEAIDVPELLEPAERLLGRLQLTGMVEVEFKRDPRDGRFKLLDINLRPWGWHTLCIACGLDFSYIQYCEALQLPQPAAIAPRYGPRWRRLITDIPAGLQEIRAGVSTPAAYLRSLGGETVSSVWDPRDPLPALGDWAVAWWRLLKANNGRAALPMARQEEFERPSAGRLSP
jgi:predicted ATP-grasp superfamily ATP-dependent carboligase